MGSPGTVRGLGLANFLPDPVLRGHLIGGVPQSDYTQPGLVGIGTRAYNFNNQPLINAKQLLIGESGVVGGNNIVAGIEIAPTANINTSASYYALNINDSPTFVTTAPGGVSAMLNVISAWTFNVAASKATINGMNFAPTVAGSQTINSLIGIASAPTLSIQATVPSFYGVKITPSVAAGTTVTAAYGVAVGISNAGTITTMVGLDVGVATGLAGSTIWAMKVGAYNSYFNGKTTFGGTATPAYAVDLAGGATSILRIQSSTTAPTVPTTALLSGGGATLSVYEGTGGANTYLLIAVDDATTTRYKYMLLNGTGTTWTEGTSLPT